MSRVGGAVSLPVAYSGHASDSCLDIMWMLLGLAAPHCHLAEYAPG